MKIELDLSDIALAYLNELAKQYETTPSEVVCGLLAGFCLDNLVKDLKPSEMPKKRVLRKLNKIVVKQLAEKRFSKRSGNAFEYLSSYGFPFYTNNEED
jgi:hypothetical protein